MGTVSKKFRGSLNDEPECTGFSVSETLITGVKTRRWWYWVGIRLK